MKLIRLGKDWMECISGAPPHPFPGIERRLPIPSRPFEEEAFDAGQETPVPHEESERYRPGEMAAPLVRAHDHAQRRQQGYSINAEQLMESIGMEAGNQQPESAHLATVVPQDLPVGKQESDQTAGSGDTVQHGHHPLPEMECRTTPQQATTLTPTTERTPSDAPMHWNWEAGPLLNGTRGNAILSRPPRSYHHAGSIFGRYEASDIMGGGHRFAHAVQEQQHAYD